MQQIMIQVERWLELRKEGKTLRHLAQAPTDNCRGNVDCRVAVNPRRLKTSSMSRLGPTYSMFICSGDFINAGRFIWKPFFWCQRALMQSSTRAIRPVATMALKLDEWGEIWADQELDSLSHICQSLRSSFVTNPQRTWRYPPAFGFFHGQLGISEDVRDNVSDGVGTLRVH